MRNKMRKRNTDKEAIINGFWVASAILCELISPIGILIAIGLFIYEYRNYELLEKNILLCGIGDFVFSIGIAFMFCLFTLTSGDMMIALSMSAFYAQGILCGLIMIAFYFIIKRKKYLCEICLMLIHKEHIVSIVKIADIMELDYKKAEKIVNYLIKTKRIKNARIDIRTKEIYFEKSVWAKQHVVCENCAAELIVDFGQTLVCEYCGSALRVKRLESPEWHPET